MTTPIPAPPVRWPDDFLWSKRLMSAPRADEVFTTLLNGNQENRLIG